MWHLRVNQGKGSLPRTLREAYLSCWSGSGVWLGRDREGFLARSTLWHADS